MAYSVADKTLTLKTGSTVILSMAYTDGAEPPVELPLDGYEINVKFIHPKTKKVLFSASIGAGVVVLDPSSGKYIVNAGSSTGWPLGLMPVDIRYTKSGLIQHTEDFFLGIVEGKS